MVCRVIIEELDNPAAPVRREQITRLAEALSAGQTFGRTVSFTDTIDAALDALEAKLKGEKR